MQTIGYDTSCCTASPRSNRDIVAFCPVDEIPYDQEIIYISHLLNNTQLIMKLISQLAVIIRVSLCQSVKTQLIQITPGIIPLWYIEFRQLGHTKLNLYITTVCYLGCIIQCLLRIGEELAHLQFTLYIVLSTFITHSVRICHKLRCLDTQQNVMRLRIFCIRIVNIISCHQGNIQLLAHAHQCCINCLLLRYAMILQFQEIIAFSKAGFITECCLLCLIIKSLGDVALYLTRKTCGQADDSLMKLVQYFHIHTRLIIIPFRKATAHDLHQIGITLVILG